MQELAVVHTKSKPITKAAPPVLVSEQNLQTNKRRKLSYKEQRELETLPVNIESLEKEQATIQKLLDDG